MELFKKQKEIVHFLCLYCVSRIFILFLPGGILYLLDIIGAVFDSAHSTMLSQYPPLFLLQLTITLSLFGKNLAGYRLGLMLYEFGSLIVLYKFVQRIQTQEFHKTPSEAASSAIRACYIFAFSPFTLFCYLIFGEFIATFFMILGLYAFYSNRHALGSLFLCLGFLTEYYPVFCLVPVFIHLLINKQFKDLVKIIASFLITFVVANIILWLTFSSNIFYSYLTQFSRTQSYSLWDIIKDFLPTWNLFSLFNLIQISPVGLTFITVFLIYCIYVMFYFYKNKTATHKQELIWYFFLTLLLPGIFLSLLPRSIFFGFPVFCLFIQTKMTIQKQKRFYLILTSVIIIFSIMSLIAWPDLTLITPTVELENILNDSEMKLPLFNIIVGFYVTFGVIWAARSKTWLFYGLRGEYPNSLTYFIYAYLLFMIQFSLAPFFGNMLVVILVIVFFIWGYLFLYRIAKRILIEASIEIDIISRRLDIEEKSRRLQI